MDLLKQLIIIDKSSDVPMYLQIANAMILSIRQGRMRPGLKLPGSRQLAATSENPSKDNAGCPRGTHGAGVD